MTRDRSEDSDGQRTSPRGGRVLLVAGLALALGAAAVLVLSDELRWLRLGVVAALWAALVGAFLAARYRGHIVDRDDRVADLQTIYALELEREVAARREYELQVEAEIRTKIEEESRESRQEVVALRNELRTLRQTLEGLLGGEVLVERYALHAQSTRMRSLEDARAPAARQAPIKRLTAGVSRGATAPAAAHEPVTEQFDRVVPIRPPQPQSPPAAVRRAEPLPRRTETARPAWPVREPERPVREPERPVREPARPVVEPIRPPAEQPKVVEQPRVVEPLRTVWDERRVEPMSHPAIEPVPHPAEVSDRWFMPEGPKRESPPPAPAVARQEPARPPQLPPSEPVERLDPGWTPSWEQNSPAPAESPGMTGRHPDQQGAHAHRDESNLRRMWEPAEPVSELPPLPAAGGRRRRADAAEPPSYQDQEPNRRHARPETGGGRRRRAEENTGSWQEQAAWRDGSSSGAWSTPNRNGSHARADVEQPDPRAGSHAVGQSVSDLLAAYGTTDPPRRRRRAE